MVRLANRPETFNPQETPAANRPETCHPHVSRPATPPEGIFGCEWNGLRGQKECRIRMGMRPRTLRPDVQPMPLPPAPAVPSPTSSSALLHPAKRPEAASARLPPRVFPTPRGRPRTGLALTGEPPEQGSRCRGFEEYRTLDPRGDAPFGSRSGATWQSRLTNHVTVCVCVPGPRLRA